ncbi:luciferase [Embleya scabrispora]|uniref:Luciferase n=1 Tax=Embleya scabrispora TaxID=159449 RepID=A0A1T3NZD3_9ACTN|nr:LLM class flavin-dependent oxidoreductase [Embleya scabrispora]OPC82085.1 luciferase [Embleya scabrispora]
MRLSTVILPIHRWTEGRKIWRQAEDLGFHAAYTYDHLSWRSFREHTWFGAIPTLTAAAAATERLRLGTMVTSPNFRHPVTLAKDLAAIDDISGGRLIAGVGAGGNGFDATALGGQPWTPKERADRLAEFVPLLDRLLSEPAVTSRGTYYTAEDVRMIPGGRQRPRVPMYLAATGPRGMRLTARHGQGWITYGDTRDPKGVPAEVCPKVIAEQLARLSDICASEGRKPEELERVLLQGSTLERPLDSMDAFVDYAGRYRELGITELAIHWPIPDSVFAADQAVFERIACEGLGQLG